MHLVKFRAEARKRANEGEDEEKTRGSSTEEKERTPEGKER